MSNLEHTTFFARKRAVVTLKRRWKQEVCIRSYSCGRTIEQVKNYRILQGAIPISLHAQLEMKLGLFVAYILTNVLPALVQ